MLKNHVFYIKIIRVLFQLYFFPRSKIFVMFGRKLSSLHAYITMLLHKNYCRYIFQYLFTLSQKGIMMFICKLSSLHRFKNLIWSKVTCHFQPQLLSTPGRTRHALHRTFREPTRQCNLAVKSLPAPAKVVVTRRRW